MLAVSYVAAVYKRKTENLRDLSKLGSVIFSVFFSLLKQTCGASSAGGVPLYTNLSLDATRSIMGIASSSFTISTLP